MSVAEAAPRSQPGRRGALFVIGAALAGCVPALPGQGPGPREYRLTPKTSFPPDLPIAGWSLAVAEPMSERALDVNRVALVEDGIRVDYYADAVWSDRAPAMIQNLIVQSFSRAGSPLAVGSDRDRLRPDFLLRPNLRAFQTRVRGGQPVDVLVVLDAELQRLPRREPVGRQVFQSSFTPTATDSLAAVILAYDEALGAVLKQLVLWTITTGEAAAPARSI